MLISVDRVHARRTAPRRSITFSRSEQTGDEHARKSNHRAAERQGQSAGRVGGLGGATRRRGRGGTGGGRARCRRDLGRSRGRCRRVEREVGGERRLGAHGSLRVGCARQRGGHVLRGAGVAGRVVGASGNGTVAGRSSRVAGRARSVADAELRRVLVGAIAVLNELNAIMSRVGLERAIGSPGEGTAVGDRVGDGL